MKIGILTFHRAHNYGAVLQCYALQKTLELMGHNVSIIDYKLDILLECYKPFILQRFISKNPFKCLKKTYKELKIINERKNRFSKFNNFINNYLNISPLDSIITNKYDLIIIGSDQVWNTKLTHGFDDYYWGNIKNTKAKIISYAASIEEFWGKDDNQLAKQLLEKFQLISVREESAAIELEKILPHKNISVNVDPTLLLNKDVWDTIAVKPKIKEKYLLLYQVRDSQKTIEIAKQIAKTKNLKILYLSARVDTINSKECISASPEEFIGYIKYASYVVSSSFHGTIFSIIFERPFSSIRLNDGKDSRIENILNSLNLSDNFISEYSHISLKKNDLDQSKYYLSNYIKKSILYLKDINDL